jgi:hypothetical protein
LVQVLREAIPMRRDEEPGWFVLALVTGIALVSGIAGAIVSFFSHPNKQEKQTVRR